MSNLHPIMQQALAPFVPPPETRDQRRDRLQRTVSELNDTSTECLSAMDTLRIMDLEDENAKLREREQRIRELCTTDYESKSVFIARVLAVLNA